MRRLARIDCRPSGRIWSLSSAGSAGDDSVSNAQDGGQQRADPWQGTEASASDL